MTNSQLARLDDNVYIRAGEPVDVFAIWSPAEGANCTAQYKTLDKFQQANPQFEKHGKYFGNSYGAIFKNAELGDYELVEASPEIEDSLPASIRQLLGWSKRDALIPGAYPLRR